MFCEWCSPKLDINSERWKSKVRRQWGIFPVERWSTWVVAEGLLILVGFSSSHIDHRHSMCLRQNAIFHTENCPWFYIHSYQYATWRSQIFIVHPTCLPILSYLGRRLVLTLAVHSCQFLNIWLIRICFTVLPFAFPVSYSLNMLLFLVSIDTV